ncbi:beta-N-acetylhexosaminidase [Seonamhaeicola marinus]|uniref:beta-N-acetylhexosaminidase n=1 Tax=Seonamhaeicola marinus TaxID=1912246 RepID=A0A5D0J9B4_9FLAO|nr:beta-N-acetylhexosaminidase [Seonamhaeicola marinus]TYA92334.1 beta-N-acetylhexosaminidase [Seonamhaeicola marinus]
MESFKKLIYFIYVCLIVSSCSNKYKAIVNTDEDYQIIPKPVFLEAYKGRFLVDSNTKISGSEDLRNEGEYLAEMLNHVANFSTSFKVGASGDILLKLDESIENEEGYTVSVTYDKIVLSGKTAKGVFYGIQTLRQLLPASIKPNNNKIKALTIPAVEIKDYPRYVYRGMHLDVGRHFFSVDFIKKYIDFIVMHKMNTFHWHLTEDQGWRIEIKKYPKLTSIGSERKETIVGHGGTWNSKDVKYDGKPFGGYYTQEQIKDIVAYATKRHVTIIPEIELPGHSLAAIAAYPELGNTGEQYEVGTRWGVYPEIYAPTEKTFSFLEDVLTEVMDLFPSEYIHIGGDEAPKKQWEKSVFAQQLIKEKDLKDEHGLQSYFIQRIEKFLNSKGRSIIGWDEILEGGLAPNATVMSWRGTKGGIAAAKEHHDVIMTPQHACYFDHYQVKTKEAKAKEPLAIGGNVTVSDVYAYEPTPEELTEEESNYILGAQGNVWTEYIKTTEHLEYMVLPRMTALSEVVWSSKKHRDWEDFHKRLQYIVKRYDALGYNYAKHSIIDRD